MIEASRSVESKVMEHEGFYKELIRNNMLVEIEIRRILQEMCNQQQANERLSKELEQKLGEVRRQDFRFKSKCSIFLTTRIKVSEHFA